MPPIRRNRRNGRDRNQPKPISDSCTTILDLNEHCLLDVFRLLSPLDMCSVFDTCLRFREVARIRMTSFYRSNELILGDQATNAIIMLCKFGAAVTKLRLELWHYQYCKVAFSWFRKLNLKLDSLTLSVSVKDLNAVHMLRPILGNLRQFRIEYVVNYSSCDIHCEDTIKDLLKACTNVEEFSFGGKRSNIRGDMRSRCQGIFLQLKFKRIRSLEICEVRDFDIDNLKIFLKLNPNVQRISIKDCVGLDQLAAFNLSQYAPNLEAVALKFSVDDHAAYDVDDPFNIPLASMLSQLEKLKCLALQACYMDIRNFIASLAKRNTLVYLSLTHVVHVNNEGLGAAFTNMTNLKVLRLHIIFHADRSEFFTQMCKHLVSLEELHLSNTYITSKQIGEIIENSVNLKKLYFPNSFGQVSDGVLNEDVYGDFVRMQSRKNVPFPLTFFFRNLYFCVVMVSLRNALNRDVINVSQFDLADFDHYTIPHSIP